MRRAPGAVGAYAGSRAAAAAAAALATLAASTGPIGSDALWLVPLGKLVAQGHVPSSIPFATAPTSGWPDVAALGQLVFWGAYRALGGDRGILVVQVAAAAVAFWALARGLVRQAPGGAALLVSALVLIGALPGVVVASASAFSLALFPVLLALLEAESRLPGRRIWLAVPLLALWGNLHGGVLAGWALLACYLLLERGWREPRLAAGVLAAATLALFANPALWRTPLYYQGVFESEVARRGEGLWTPLGTGTLDLVLMAAAAALAVFALLGGARVGLWEAVALLGLAGATVHVARNGVQLVFLLAYPAARGLRLGAPKPRLLLFAAALLAAGAAAGTARRPAEPESRAPAREAARSGKTVLATALLGQQVVLAGGRVWVENPIDAFRQSDQRLYLDWLSGKPSGAAAVTHAAFVLVQTGSAAAGPAASDRRLRLVLERGGAALYAVRAPVR